VSTALIQVIGTRDSAETRKAERFFKERRVPMAFVDLKERPLSRGELENIARSTGVDGLLDHESRAYVQAGLAYLVVDPIEEALKNPLLLKMPIVRRGREATLGHRPDVWETWFSGAAT
jgi:arsenate reductase-like glutaredoxin family protein